MHHHRSVFQARHRGFTLIELLIAVAVVSILLALAVPGYREYVRRGAVEEALASVSAGRVAFEQHFLDQRTYAAVSGIASPCPANTTRFVMTCARAATTFTITATGSGNLTGFVYTVNQAGARTTAGPWGSGACWISRKGDSC